MQIISKMTARVLLILAMTLAPIGMLSSQEVNKKYAITTQMFLDEQKEQQAAAGRHRAPAATKGKTNGQRSMVNGQRSMVERLIASPDTIGGVVYISCFVHLADPADLSAVRALGVQVQSTFPGLDFITANVPVSQLEALAQVDNVTQIKVAQCMQPDTYWSRNLTHVDDLLTQSATASALGIDSKYDGTGVVLGIIDSGIDYQHIAFKDKDGNCRIKRAYVYDGNSGHVYYTPGQIAALTTDDKTMDHGTHTASTAGGSSVIVVRDRDQDGKITGDAEVTVTDDHSQATYGGMAPGADLYLAGVKSFTDTYMMNAFSDMIHYADSLGKPLVVSNSWGYSYGPCDGTGEWAEFVARYFGDSHPNHIVVFCTGNHAAYAPEAEGGGFFVSKKDARLADPLFTIVRSWEHGGNHYQFYFSSAYSDKPMLCYICLIDTKTNTLLGIWYVTASCVLNNVTYTDAYQNEHTCYTGDIHFYFYEEGGRYNVRARSIYGLTSAKEDTYTLALGFAPADWYVTADIHSWACREYYYTGFLGTTDGITWTPGTNDMSVDDQATIPDVISVGAYVSRRRLYSYNGHSYTYNNLVLDDIADFSSYATAEVNPTGVTLPWIVGPGCFVVAAGNHFHTLDVDNASYYNTEVPWLLTVNHPENPYVNMQGTSMSTPVVSGIVAQWLQASLDEHAAHKNLTVNDVKDIMRRTAIHDKFTEGPNASHFGQGKIDALEGIRYILTNGLSLSNDEYNSEKIKRNGDITTNIVLKGRTLYKDGAWNTLCLPFNLTAEQVATSLESPTGLMTLSSSSFNNGELTLTFTHTTTIEAGKPYIIRWDKADGYDQASEDTRDLKNPEFTNVTLVNAAANVATTYADFKGTYNPVSYGEENRSILFLGKGNTLYYPQSGASIGACRAYFLLNGLTAGDVQNARMNFDDETTQGIVDAEENTSFFILHSSFEEGWYDMQGRKLEKQPTKPGLYIHGNIKVVITHF